MWTPLRISKERCCAMQLHKAEHTKSAILWFRIMTIKLVEQFGLQRHKSLFQTHADDLGFSTRESPCWWQRTSNKHVAQTLAYSLLKNIPALPEVILSGPQFCRAAGDVQWSSAAGSGRGQTCEMEDILEPLECEP